MLKFVTKIDSDSEDALKAHRQKQRDVTDKIVAEVKGEGASGEEESRCKTTSGQTQAPASPASYNPVAMCRF
jgi:hypothetical protein